MAFRYFILLVTFQLEKKFSLQNYEPETGIVVDFCYGESQKFLGKNHQKKFCRKIRTNEKKDITLKVKNRTKNSVENFSDRKKKNVCWKTIPSV